VGTITYRVPASLCRIALLGWQTVSKALELPEDRFAVAELDRRSVQQWYDGQESLATYVEDHLRSTPLQDPAEGIVPGQSVAFDSSESPWPDVLAAAHLALHLHKEGHTERMPVVPQKVRSYLQGTKEAPAKLPFRARQLSRVLQE
jgi:hypothetical protein